MSRLSVSARFNEFADICSIRRSSFRICSQISHRRYILPVIISLFCLTVDAKSHIIAGNK
jgi:hypothetical protein